MTSKSHLDLIRDFVRKSPEVPGVYIVKGDKNVPIYVGKAKSLRNRLKSHFIPKEHPDYKERRIRKDARSVDIIETSSEAEALLLEAGLIKQYRPKYNKEMKDDKSFPYLKLTSEKYPRLILVRGRPNDGSKYYGPFTSVRLLKQSIALLRRMFPMRTCNPMPSKICLQYHIGQCPGPCEEKISETEYKQRSNQLKMFLDGKRDALIRSLTRSMQGASKDKDFESARVYRDQIRALSSLSQDSDRTLPNSSSVLMELQRLLSLDRFPSRIEAFDISNFSGKHAVGSMVVFENGMPKKSDYRKYKIKHVKGIDDYQMMREIVSRRYKRLLKERRDLPDLIIIDGGRGHLSSAKQELDALNLSDRDLISIAKQHEYLFKPERLEPYVLRFDSSSLKLIRYIRDEAHRFAITFYRSLHRKEMTASQLDEIPGVGSERKKQLLKAFKSVKNIKRLTVDEIVRGSKINRGIAQNIEEYFRNS